MMSNPVGESQRALFAILARAYGAENWRAALIAADVMARHSGQLQDSPSAQDIAHEIEALVG